MAFVHLTVAADEGEAEVLCSLLRASGIGCIQRPTDIAVGRGDGLATFGGPHEVLVEERDLEAARALLATRA